MWTKRPDHRSLSSKRPVVRCLSSVCMQYRSPTERLRSDQYHAQLHYPTRYETGSVLRHQKPGRRLLVALPSHRQHCRSLSDHRFALGHPETTAPNLQSVDEPPAAIFVTTKTTNSSRLRGSTALVVGSNDAIETSAPPWLLLRHSPLPRGL